jgi:hypothetical protein
LELLLVRTLNLLKDYFAMLSKAALQNRRVRRYCQPLGALKELRVSGESEKEEELTQTELEPQVFGFVGQTPRLMKLQFGAVEQSTVVVMLAFRVKDDQRRGDGDWKTR